MAVIFFFHFKCLKKKDRSFNLFLISLRAINETP